jgi:hypothetical protein
MARSRVATDTLVVEGWIHGFAIQAAVQEFRAGRYEHLFTTAGRVAETGDMLIIIKRLPVSAQIC